MGGGLCIPPMMLPPAMQHLQMPHMPHFPHLGMGMGLGYGMGLFDMNRTTTVPFPPMPGGHFPCQTIPGAAPQGLGIPGRNTLPMFGVPGPPIHPSVSGVQPFPSSASLPIRPNMAPQVSATVANMVLGQQQVTNQQHQSLNDEGTQGASTGGPQLQTVLQVTNHKKKQMKATLLVLSLSFLSNFNNRSRWITDISVYPLQHNQKAAIFWMVAATGQILP
jgi:phytochrome-interacting factor 3